MKGEIAIGVDVGGSHISCVAFDLSNRIYLEDTFAENQLNNQGEADEIIDSWGKTIKEAIETVGVERVGGIGFAMPGPFNYVEGIPLFKGDNKKYENIYGLNVPEKLRHYLGFPDNFKIRFINDATAFAIGEDQVGKAKDYSKSLSITLGSGFGSAFIQDAVPVVSGDTIPENGCMWHLPFESGIADDYFSTRGFLNRYYTKTGIKLKGVRELSEIAGQDLIAKSLFDDFGLKLGVFLKPWIRRFGIEVLVIGGNISNAFDLFEPELHSYLTEQKIEIAISASELKEKASFIGSAVLIDDSFYAKIKPLLHLM